MDTVKASLPQLAKAVVEPRAGGEVLEVGVGTGRNFPYHEKKMHVTAIDLSPKMLRRADNPTCSRRHLSTGIALLVTSAREDPSGVCPLIRLQRAPLPMAPNVI
jgi:ubiquinone/menaquinone biosynthesis C-methylase UbiE